MAGSGKGNDKTVERSLVEVTETRALVFGGGEGQIEGKLDSDEQLGGWKVAGKDGHDGSDGLVGGSKLLEIAHVKDGG